MTTVIVLGASSAIAQAIIHQHLADAGTHVLAISRQSMPKLLQDKDNLQWQQCDYSDEERKKALASVADSNQITHVYICHGILHRAGFLPEKKLESLAADFFQQTMAVNALLPMFWLQDLLPYLSKQENTKLVVFSARIGSIGDNESGGWYSYRASKAALNMLLKTAAIEYARRAQGVKLIAFHPGTTDTPLSVPFQKSTKNKIFTPQFVAEQVLTHADAQSIDGKLAYIDWKGEEIVW